MRLEGKVAILSGAAGGMGAEEARLFAREGAAVTITDLREDDGARVEAEIVESGGRATFLRADVTSDEDWRNVVRETVSRYGRLDILVNNAGISSSAYPDPLGIDGWQDIMDVNSTGVFLGTRNAIPEMLKTGGGSIVNISSIMGFVGGAGHPGYNAAKGAVRIFTKAMAVRYGPQGIRVNSVHPGFMPPMGTSTVAPDSVQRRKVIALTPLGRTGETIEVAYGVLFLASDEASFITGTELVIDGGFIAR